MTHPPIALPRISSAVIESDLATLATFSQPGPGVTRLAWTEELRAANTWLERRMNELGLEVHVDAAGNVFGKWAAGSGRAVLTGSHLDSVPNGGRYDGPVGVVSAIRAVEAIKSGGVVPSRPIWVVSWMDEEGSRFGTGLLGSRAFAGKNPGGASDRTDAAGINLKDAMRSFGLDFRRVAEASAADRVGAYIELHIEQGSRLHDSGIDLGVVTGIAGLFSFNVVFHGEANHAGTTPMRARRDALAAAAHAALAVREAAIARPGHTANVSRLCSSSGATNIIPGTAEMVIEMRAPSQESWARLPGLVIRAVSEAADALDVRYDVSERHRLEPALLDDDLTQLLENAAHNAGASTMRMFSSAGHDAMSLAHCVPTAMIFVPSPNGISHDPREYSDPDACALGATALAHALAMISTRPG